MPLAPVNNKGTQLYYEDTGALEGVSYTTLIIVHGTGIHGGTLCLCIMNLNRTNYNKLKLSFVPCFLSQRRTICELFW